MEKTGGEAPKVLSVGQCDMDHRLLSGFLTRRFKAQVERADGLADALGLLEKGDYHLVLVNRMLDMDYSPGLDVIRSLKAADDPRVSGVPVMMVSNYPDAQQEAVAAGAEKGFGKAELDREETAERLAGLFG